MDYQKRHLPPPEYDHDYDGELTIMRTLEPIVHRACKERIKDGNKSIGCSQIKQMLPRSCTIWILTDEELKATGWDYDIVFRHERAHCNGWRH